APAHDRARDERRRAEDSAAGQGWQSASDLLPLFQQGQTPRTCHPDSHRVDPDIRHRTAGCRVRGAAAGGLRPHAPSAARTFATGPGASGRPVHGRHDRLSTGGRSAAVAQEPDHRQQRPASEGQKLRRLPSVRQTLVTGPGVQHGVHRQGPGQKPVPQ
nr:hypothetical protein [Tanacetum cinerariifolium]